MVSDPLTSFVAGRALGRFLWSRPEGRRHDGSAMPDYRFYLLDGTGRIARRVDAVCADDAEALAQARSFGHRHAVEVWQGTRTVGRVERAIDA